MNAISAPLFLKPDLRHPISKLLLLLVLLTGCAEEKVALSYLGVNHTSKGVATFAINGEGGILNVPPYGGGGGSVCCVSVPKQWRPGLVAKIDWQESGRYVRDDQADIVLEDGLRYGVIEGAWKSKTVPIPEYKPDEMEHFDVHFFANDEIQVKVGGRMMPYHPDYRPSYPIDPSRAKP